MEVRARGRCSRGAVSPRSFCRLPRIEYEGAPAKVLRPEYLIAIAASVGRHKDLARIDQMLEQAEIDRTLLDDFLRRYNLHLPTP